MNILLTNNHLINVGGSETWTLTMAAEMKRRGFSVDVLTLHCGNFADQFKGIAELNPPLKNSYDLILVNHNSCLKVLLEKGVSGFKIMTSHGTVPLLEQPMEGANAYVAISEEVQLHLSRQGFDSTVIRNPIDCDKFFPKKPINDELKNILLISDYSTAREIAEMACKRLGISFQFIGKNNPRFDTENAINDADLIISLGRGCYEAMACGRNVIVFDTRLEYMQRFADGLVTRETIDGFLKNNCSGRRNKFQWTADELSQEMQKYHKAYGTENKIFALENFNVRKIADEYLALANL